MKAKKKLKKLIPYSIKLPPPEPVPVPQEFPKSPMERLEELEATVAKLSERMEKMANAFNNHIHQFVEPNDDPYNPFTSYRETGSPDYSI